jgi:hypothetical protein
LFILKLYTTDNTVSLYYTTVSLATCWHAAICLYCGVLYAWCTTISSAAAHAPLTTQNIAALVAMATRVWPTESLIYPSCCFCMSASVYALWNTGRLLAHDLIL